MQIIIRVQQITTNKRLIFLTHHFSMLILRSHSIHKQITTIIYEYHGILNNLQQRLLLLQLSATALFLINIFSKSKYFWKGIFTLNYKSFFTLNYNWQHKIPICISFLNNSWKTWKYEKLSAVARSSSFNLVIHS